MVKLLKTLTPYPNSSEHPKANITSASYRIIALIANVTVIDMKTLITIDRVPEAPRQLEKLSVFLLSPTPRRVKVNEVLRSLNITDIAAEAGTLSEPKVLRRTTLAITIVRKTHTSLSNVKRLGRKTLR